MKNVLYLVIFESAQHFRSGNYYTINVVPGFRSDSSLYCYRPVSYVVRHRRLIYHSVTTEATNESYVGLATNFKDRYRNHMTSFRHANRRNETELSKYIWTLKDARKPFRVQWKVLATCKPYDNMSKKCNLCLKEKFFIICRNDLCTLNKRNELASSCPHRNRFTLKNFKIR